MPKFLAWLPKPQQARLEAIVEREITKWVCRFREVDERQPGVRWICEFDDRFGPGACLWRGELAIDEAVCCEVQPLERSFRTRDRTRSLVRDKRDA